MKRLTFTWAVLIVGVCAAFAPLAVAQHEHPAGDPTKLGKVTFPVSCDPSLQPQFSSAVAMLHSFWYEKASETFASIAEKDPTCGMAYWGIAMTYWHPIRAVRSWLPAWQRSQVCIRIVIAKCSLVDSPQTGLLIGASEKNAR